MFVGMEDALLLDMGFIRALSSCNENNILSILF